MSMWKKPRSPRTPPSSGKTYHDWKDTVAEDCHRMCVYCAIGESAFGFRGFAVEHFRPKSRPEFKHLENDVENLYFACAICNSFKGDDWPGEAPAFPEKSFAYHSPMIGYGTLFTVVGVEVTGADGASKYMIERLYLNRPQLLLDRRKSVAIRRWEQAENRFRRLFESHDINHADARTLIQYYAELNQQARRVLTAIAYEPADVKR